nr:immunoglobulin heavy chain junction region [Macaca mulatta]MOW23222.1 immunoglobulin heavy chain junction region [Macaca mulatta]MOW23282.1 immunoglobulin heavy chain junction region [Macaca mulatta]MOW23284.1 immunoglobulin heavy chain junction region [Macaca mulatta]MOW23318.1 immunoglobulin heavy chain junction region [Macaca mulatta]
CARHDYGSADIHYDYW